MARKPAPRSGELFRKTGVNATQCGHRNPTTGLQCLRQGTFGLGPPMYPTEEARCAAHRKTDWPDYFSKERQWNA